jgi:surface protein
MASDLGHQILMMVARFVASDRLENPVGFFKRLRAMRLTNTKMKDAVDSALSGHAALVLRIALPQLVSTKLLIEAMKNDATLAKSVVETKSTSPGILSRLVELSEAATRTDPESKAAAKHAKALIDSARDLLRDSLARATVGTDTTTPPSKVPMYDDPEGLANKVIERLKSGPRYEQITADPGRKVRVFLKGTSAERSACEYGPLCIWDVHAINCNFVCSELAMCPVFNSDLYWDTRSVTTMTNMFNENSEFKGDLSTWDVRKVTNMAGMFAGSGIEDSGIGDWNTASLEDAGGMFVKTSYLSMDIDLSGWTTGKCTNMVSMFRGSTLVDGKIGKWDVANTNTTNMLRDAPKFKGNLGSWHDTKQRLALTGSDQVGFGLNALSARPVRPEKSARPVRPASEKPEKPARPSGLPDSEKERRIRRLLAKEHRTQTRQSADSNCTIL